MHRRHLHATLVVAAFALVGCGTTVPVSSQTVGVQPGLGGSIASAGSTPMSGNQQGTATTVAGAQGLGAATGNADAPGVGTTATTLTGKGTGSVEIGFAYLANVQAFAAAFGASADPGDQQVYIRAAVNWANAHGGLNGHQITPVFFAVDATSTKPYSQTAQEGCDKLTQDHHVAAVFLGGIDAPPLLPHCLNDRKVFYTVSDHSLHDHPEYAALPYMVTPANSGIDRTIPELFRNMTRSGLIKAGTSVGLLIGDLPAAQRVTKQILEPMVKAMGAKLVTEVISPPQSTAEVGNSIAVIQSAVLKMRSAGVTAVTFICPGCMTQFMQEAESQKYRPKYAFTSLDSPTTLVAAGGAAQLTGSLGLSWEPNRDIDLFAQPKAFTGNSTRDLCLKIERATGMVNSGLRVYASQTFCDGMMFIRAAANASRASTITGTTLLAGANALGDSQPSALTFRTLTTPEVHDGVQGYRIMVYDAACNCVRYKSYTVSPLP